MVKKPVRKQPVAPKGRIQLTLDDVKLDADPYILAGMAHELVRNPEFRDAFEKDPATILTKVGFRLPKGVDTVVEPRNLAIALSDIQREDLNEVAAILAPLVRVLTSPVTRVATRVAPGVRTRVTTNPVTQTRVTTNPVTQTRVSTNPATQTRVTTNAATQSTAVTNTAVTVGVTVATRMFSIMERGDVAARREILRELSKKLEDLGAPGPQDTKDTKEPKKKPQREKPKD